ncbi:tyrosine-type recombinase/integrase [Paracandidimonas soli]|uniref:Site-specific recombinase XerD n=1 Tax=Paracandidimonas soli TaxID=1917182 RepID=A0A4R3V1I9_9BURK|nr:site-specific integrase [Paracandidimonas soli]TCU97291.1 site-specific recombinase XerD [Paracandidimonas soli]
MPIRQRNGVWWIDFRTPSGQRIRRSTGTPDKKAAQEYHDRLKAQLWRQHKLGEQADRSYDEAALRFLAAYEGQADYESKVRYVEYWRQHLGRIPVANISTAHVLDALPTHKTYKKRGPEPLTPATKNRYLACIRTMLNMCAAWGWIARAPQLPALPEPKRRVRWIPRGEAAKLIQTVPQEWLRDACILGFATGMREDEIYGLEWSHVNLPARTAWVDADRAKSGRSRTIPLNDDAMAVLQRRKGADGRYVLMRNGRRIRGGDDRMFRQSVTDAGIQNFRFHDIRHTWASWHAQAGTPLLVLQQLGGWETLEMVMKYAHLAPSHLASHAGAVTFWSHDQEQAQKNGNEDCALVAVAA